MQHSRSATGIVCLMVLLAQILGLGSRPAVAHAAANCTHYVDNSYSSAGNGTLGSPWNSLANHANELSPGNVLCLRGDTSGAGRIYSNPTINLTISGTPASPITLQPYPGEKVILRHTGSDHILNFKGSAYWVVQGFTVEQWKVPSSRVIQFINGAHHNTLRNNEIRNSIHDGVTVFPNATDNVIEGNHLHHFSNPDPTIDAHCVVVEAGADRTIIRQNTLHDCSGDGVQLVNPSTPSGAQYADGVMIQQNVFYRGALSRAENAIDIKAAANLEVIGNRISGYFDKTAIVMHQRPSRNVLFDANVIYDSQNGFDVHYLDDPQPEALTLRNNIFHNLTGYGVQISGVTDGTFAHNTFAYIDSQAFRIVGYGLLTGDFRNNLVIDGGQVQVKAPLTGVTTGYNGWFDTSVDSPLQSPTDLVGSGNAGVESDAPWDFHLTLESPARDYGISVGVSTDFDGDPRPSGCCVDLGADEYTDRLRLRGAPRHHGATLTWSQLLNPNVTTYVITYGPATGGNNAGSTSAPTTVTLPAPVQSYSLTGLTNYVFYTVTISARDAANTELFLSNSIEVMPTDKFVYLPMIRKRR